MALSSNLFRLRDTKNTKLEKAGAALAIANAAFVTLDGDGLTEEERNALLLEEAISSAIGDTISAAREFAEKRLSSAKEFQAGVQDFERTLAGVENAAKSGDVVTLIGGLLPGVGPVIRKLDLRDLLKRIDAKADPIAADVDRALAENQAVIDKLENAVKILVPLDNTVTAIEVALDAYEFGQNLYALGAQAVVQIYEEVEPSLGPLSTDARVESAFDGLTARFEAKTDIIAEAAAAFENVSVPISTLLNEELKPSVINFQNAIDQLSGPLNSLSGFKTLANNFTTAVNAVAGPVNSFLDKLEEGPGILPSIPRSSIDKILNFLSDLSGIPLKVFNKVFGPILAPLEARADALFDRIVNLDQFSGPADLIDNLLDNALAAINQFQPLFDRIETALADLNNLPEIGFEEFVAEVGDDRVTFFGDDDDDVLVGLTVAETSNAPPLTLASATSADPDKLSDIAGAVLNGGGGADNLTGTDVEDLLIGGTGQDTLIGLGGEDVLVGGADNDTLNGGLGNDVIDGGAGQDVAVFAGLRAAFSITSTAGILSVAGPDGEDDLIGVETLRFDDGDVDVASLFPPTPPGGGGSGEGPGGGAGGDGGGDGGGSGAGGGFSDMPDIIVGDEAPDRFLGGEGGDTLLGGAGEDTLLGQAGDDRLIGGTGDDVVKGGAGADLLKGNAGADRLNGGGGDDAIRGGGGGDNIRGGAGNDNIKGNGGADTIKGNGGDDFINAGGGADLIIGGRGDDTMQGGGGADRFVFGPNDGDDTIVRFQDGVDKLEFRAANDFDDLIIRQTGDGALISFRNTSVLLEGENRNIVTEDDFIF